MKRVIEKESDIETKRKLSEDELLNATGGGISSSKDSCSALHGKDEIACQKDEACVWSTKNGTCEESV
jgi:hypothetical protein